MSRLALLMIVWFGMWPTGPRQARADLSQSEIDELAMSRGRTSDEFRERYPGVATRLSSEPEPDRQVSGDDQQLIGAASTGMGSTHYVLNYGEANTTRAANYGIIHYMSASVATDDHFFMMADRFLEKLHQLDAAQPSPRPYEMAAIQKRAPQDLFRIALTIAGGSPYSALKLMALYGHDNESHELYEKRGDFLNENSPGPDSVLYSNGAIGGLAYPPRLITEAGHIAAACNAPNMTPTERAMCNDGHRDYQGDYYHVIAAAFMGCRARISENMSSNVITGSALTSAGFELGYPKLARVYKLQRFAEEVKANSADLPAAELELLKKGLERIATNVTPVIEPYAKLSGISRRDYDAAAAIVNRHKFEVDFREYQHRLGMEFGRKLCKGVTSFNWTAPTTCH